MRNRAKDFFLNSGGNISILTAFGLMIVIGFAALGVDVGSVFADRRKLQTMADLAAITSASNLAKADVGALATLRSNNMPASALLAVETGVYTPSPALDIPHRFSPSSAAGANAARVTLQTQTPLFFGRFITGSDRLAISTKATATSTAMASFAIGSRLASLNNGLLNGILGSMLGTTLSLSTMDYQALLDARIDALDFLNALATKADITAGTYSDLLNTRASVSTILQAILATQKSANGNTSATAALTALTQSSAGLSTKITTAKLLGVGPYGSLQLGDRPNSANLLSVYDLIAATAQIANGSQQIALNANLGLPGIASVSFIASLGERPAGASWFSIGPTGTSVHTAQMRVLLNISLIGTPTVPAVNLPVYIEVGAGTATLASVSCAFPDTTASTASLNVKPAAIDARIGQVTAAELSNFSTEPDPPPATLVNLGLVLLKGRAHATIANPQPKLVSFTYSDVQAQTKKSVTTLSFTTSLIGSLLEDLQLNVVLIGLGLPIPGLTATVAGLLSGAAPAIDTVLVTVLNALGVGLGQSDVWVTGIRCDGAVLVN